MKNKKRYIPPRILEFITKRNFNLIEDDAHFHYSDDFYDLCFDDTPVIVVCDNEGNTEMIDNNIYSIAGWYYLTYSKLSILNLSI